MANLRVTELDFNNIKGNLKTFLEAQSEFSDYNFSGSALNVMLDILAYNTHYNAVLAHLVANEMFLDTAIKRSSVVSIAKTLGYTPKSTTAARMTVTVIATPTNVGTAAASLTLETSHIFTGTVDGTTYVFTPVKNSTVALETGVYTFEDIELIQGTRLTNTFSVKQDTVSGPFTLPVENIDLETIKVFVRESESNTTYDVFVKADGLVDITNTTNAFWVEEKPDGRYQISFGDDIIGTKLSVGNIAIASYIATDAAGANGVNSLITSSLTDENLSAVPVTSITVVTASAAGSTKETIDSIRKNAPLYNSTRNRAVTSSDYKSLILANFDKAKSVAVWGGEENNPPIYGKVFITIDPKDDYIISEGDKDFITEKILRPRSVMSIQHEFVDPEYIYLGFNVSITYDTRLTNFSASQISSAVRTEIVDYFTEDLTTLNKTFFFSTLSDVIKNASAAINSSLFDMTVQARISPTINTSFSTTLNFLTSVEPNSIQSTVFNAKINGVTYKAFLKDFNSDTNNIEKSSGTVKLMNAETNNIIASIGVVDYTTGLATISNLQVASYLTSSGDIRILATPQELSKNILSSIKRTSQISEFAIVPEASKNIIIALNDSSANSTIGLKPGLVVSAVPIVPE